MGVDPIVTAAGQVTMSFIALAPVALLVDRPRGARPAGHPDIRFNCWLGDALHRVRVHPLFPDPCLSGGNQLLVTFLVPVSAILLGWVILGERLEAIHFVGMALIGLGLCAIDGRLWPKRSSSRDVDRETIRET